MKRIDVTKTFLPPLEEYNEYLKEIWEGSQLTNQGPLLRQFELAAKKHLNLDDFQFVGNGTVALQLALSALDITEGEVITTPFSYIATTSSIMWERCKPVFVDIKPDSFCIDADLIEAAITENTKAIMPVHVFGHPCDVEKIAAIAKKNNLKVIYDAAHAFGVTYKGKSLLSYGDIATCSFHATKLFHTIEGGCVVSSTKVLSDRVELIKHFGHRGDDHIMLGINGKASEVQAAMGLSNLKYIDYIIGERRKICEMYDQAIDKRFIRPTTDQYTQRNYAYYPIVFESEKSLLNALEALSKKNIFPRRYFYPSINTVDYVNGEKCPVSEDIALRVACLPLYVGLEKESIETIANIINEV